MRKVQAVEIFLRIKIERARDGVVQAAGGIISVVLVSEEKSAVVPGNFVLFDFVVAVVIGVNIAALSERINVRNSSAGDDPAIGESGSG